MKYSNQPFTNEPINLDDNTYIGCTFSHCEIIYSGGAIPTLTNNSFSDCSWTFDGAAARTLAFMAALYTGGGKAVIEHTLDNIRGKKKPGIKLH